MTTAGSETHHQFTLVTSPMIPRAAALEAGAASIVRAEEVSSDLLLPAPRHLGAAFSEGGRARLEDIIAIGNYSPIHRIVAEEHCCDFLAGCRTGDVCSHDSTKVGNVKEDGAKGIAKQTIARSGEKSQRAVATS